MAKEADRGTFLPVLLFGYLFRGFVTQGLEAGRGLIFPVQNGDGSVDKVTVFCGDIIFLCGVFHDIVHFPVVRFFTGKQVAADDFLGVETHGYLAAVASPCPDQGFPVMQGGFFAQKDRGEVRSQRRTCIRSCQSAQCRHHVRMESRLGDGFSRGYFPRASG